MFFLCNDKGTMYDFFIYSEKTESVLREPNFGTGSNKVLKLVQSISMRSNHLLYFTSLPFLTTLTNRKIFSLGTIRINCLPRIFLIKDKNLIKRAKESYQKYTALVENIEERVVK